MGVPLFISEFGACSDSDGCVAEITGVTETCDKYVVGWAYWEFKNYDDFTTSAIGASGNQEGFYDSTGNL